MEWLILATVIALTLSLMLLGAVISAYLLFLVMLIVLQLQGKKMGCRTDHDEVLRAICRGRGGIGIERARQRLWKSGVRLSFSEALKLAPSNRELYAYVEDRLDLTRADSSTV